MKWYHISLLLCVFGFLKEIRPSEPFVSDYMQQPYRNVTEEQLNRDIYPIATYSTVVLSLLVLLVTDWLRYKPIIILTGLSGIITWSLLLWTKTFLGAQMIEVFYALYATCEVAYFAYIYAKVSKEHFLAVSSHTRAALLVGRFMSGVLSQSLMHFKLMDIHTLNYLSLAGQLAATLITIFLPKVDKSIYFYRNKSANDVIIEDSSNNLHNNLDDKQSIKCNKCQQAFSLMWKQLKCAYSNKQVVLWSMWYACGMCGFLQYLSYVQLVWIAIDNRPELMWNGAIEAITTLISATIALLASRLHSSFINTKLKVLMALFTMSLCASGAIFLTANASHRFISYAGHVIFYAFYTFTITISSAEIAKDLPEDSYGLIFGINTFFAYFLQAILTAVVASDLFGFKWNIFQQMNIYGGFLAFVGCSYFLLMMIDGIQSIRRGTTKEINSNSNYDNNIGNIAA